MKSVKQPRSVAHGFPRLRLLVVAGLSCLLLTPIAPIFLPHTGAPIQADVILVLGPPEPSRIALAEDLLSEGYSERLVVSASDTGGPYFLQTLPICNESHDFKVLCAQSQPFTTQGEVGLLNDLAERNGWDTAIVITFTPHVSRTQLYLDRCFKGTAHVVADDRPLTPAEAAYEYVYQTGAFTKAFLSTSGCA